MKRQHAVRITTMVDYYLGKDEIEAILLNHLDLKSADCEIEMDMTTYGEINGCTIRHTTVTESEDGNL